MAIGSVSFFTKWRNEKITVAPQQGEVSVIRRENWMQQSQGSPRQLKAAGLNRPGYNRMKTNRHGHEAADIEPEPSA